LSITGELEEHAEIFYWEPDENIREKEKKKNGDGQMCNGKFKHLLDHIIVQEFL
jgi:hypothetical protein